MSERYKALVGADAIIVPEEEFNNEMEAEEWLRENIDTGDLGPVRVDAIETDDD